MLRVTVLLLDKQMHTWWQDLSGKGKTQMVPCRHHSGREHRPLVLHQNPHLAFSRWPPVVGTTSCHAFRWAPLLESLTYCDTVYLVHDHLDLTDQRDTHPHASCWRHHLPEGLHVQPGSPPLSPMFYMPVHGETCTGPPCSSLLAKLMNIP